MDDFEIIETGYASGDETINFGTRSTDGLYELSTLASITISEGKQASDVFLNCIVTQNKLLFCANNSLKLFEDTSLSSLCFSAIFRSAIASVCISNGRFLLVCLKNGCFKIFDIEQQTDDISQPVTSGTFAIDGSGDNNEAECFKVFPENRTDDTICFLVIFTNARILRIDLEVEAGETLKYQHFIENVLTLEFTVTEASYNYPFLLLDGSRCSVINIQTHTSFEDSPLGLKSAWPLHRKFLCLDTDGILHKLCCLAGIPVDVEDDTPLEDILVLNYNGQDTIFAATKKNEDGEMFIQLIQTDFTRIFSLKVEHPVYLIPSILSDEVNLISKVYDESTGLQLRFQHVLEVEPELRLKKLLRQQKFEEAEKFAQTFDIDIEIVLKAKAQLITEKTEWSSEDVNELLRLMDNINDDLFKLNCCSKVDCQNLEDIKKVYNYGSSITLKKKDEDAVLRKQLLAEQLFKLDTFMALSIDHNISSWNRFSTCKLMNIVKSYLKQRMIDDAIIVYNRLDREIVDITENSIEEIIMIIDNLPADMCAQFLSTFIPVSMSHKPSSLPIFVDWLRNKIMHLESNDPNSFPENGIEFAKTVLKLLRADEKNSILFQWQCTLYQKPINDLRSLFEGLKILKTLTRLYGIKVPLDTYIQGPEAFVKTLLCVRMQPKKYDIFFEEFLYVYIIQNQLNPDNIIHAKILELLKFGNTWMTAIEILIKYINSVTVKLQAVEDILKSAPVPWSDITKHIALSVMHYDHFMTKDIKELLEDEPAIIVLKKRVYQFQGDYKDASKMERIIGRIMDLNEPTMIEDVYDLYSRSEYKCKNFMTMHLLKPFIIDGDVGKIKVILSKNCNNDICLMMIKYCELVLNSEFDQQTKDHCYNSQEILFTQLLNTTNDALEKQRYEEYRKLLKRLYHVNNMFHKQFKSNDLMPTERRNEMYNGIIEQIEDYIDAESVEVGNLASYCLKLARCFSLDKDQVLLDVCDKLGRLDFVLKVVTHLYKNECDTQNLCTACLLLLKYIDQRTVTEETFNISMNIANMNGSDDKENIITALRLIQKLIMKGLVKSKTTEELDRTTEVMKWADCCFFQIKHADLFGKVFTEQQKLSSSLFYELRNYLELNVGCINRNSLVDPYFIKGYSYNVPSASKEALLSQLLYLPLEVNTLCMEGLHMSAFTLILTLKRAIVDCKLDNRVVKCLNQAESECQRKLIQAVCSEQEIDGDLLFNLLLLRKHDYKDFIQSLLRTYKRQFKKFELIANVSLKLITHLKDSKLKDMLTDTCITCKWWRMMKESVQGKIPYDEFFKTKVDKRLELLMKIGVLNLNLLQKYCKDYCCSFQNGLLKYLKSYLLLWKLDYDIDIGIDQQRRIITKSDENSLYLNCKEVVYCIDDKQKVLELLESVLNMISCYQYEVFICVYDTMLSINPASNVDSKLRLLSFLKRYRRCSSPCQREKEEWFNAFPENVDLDPLSEFRLPFTKLLFTEDIWSIIRPEVNLRTYKEWFLLANLLPQILKMDEICIYCIKQVVSSGILKTGDTEKWILHSRFEDLLRNVEECIKYIGNLEKATSTVYHLMYHVPNGIDKVKVARLSYEYAKKYRDENSDVEEVVKSYVKVKSKYYQYSAMHILYKYDVTVGNHYIELLQDPTSLVNALYMDPSILEHSESVCLFTVKCPDINQAVDELGMLFDLDVDKIRYTLLQKFLNNSDDPLNFDSPSYVPNFTDVKDDSNVKRAIYLCKSGKAQFWQEFLIKKTIDAETESTDFCFRARALKCLCAITDEETITNLTRVTYTEILHMIETLTLLSHLESLGITLNLESLHNCNKKEILKKLLKIRTPLAIKVMGSLCLIYHIEDLRYWEFIISNSIKFNMISDLKAYVDFLKNKCDKQFYLDAWQTIVNEAFHQTSGMPIQDCEEKLVSNFLMLQSCPVASSLNYERIMKICTNLKKYEFAALLLQYIPNEQRNGVIKHFTSQSTLLQDLEKLQQRGLCGTRQVRQWLSI